MPGGDRSLLGIGEKGGQGEGEKGYGKGRVCAEGAEGGRHHLGFKEKWSGEQGGGGVRQVTGQIEGKGGGIGD